MPPHPAGDTEARFSAQSKLAGLSQKPAKQTNISGELLALYTEGIKSAFSIDKKPSSVPLCITGLILEPSDPAV